MNNQYLASEIILAKNSAATATAKATSLLIDVYNLQLKDVKIERQINDISLQLQKINLLIESSNILLDQSSNTQLDLSFQNLLQQFNQLSTTISGELVNFNTKINDFSNNIFLINTKNNLIEQSFNLIEQSFNLINTSLVDLSKNIYNYVDDSIINIIDNAPDNLNSFKELANALQQDPSFATTIISRITNLDTSFSNIDLIVKDISQGILQLLENAPDNLNSFNELANALQQDPSFATTVLTKIFLLDQSVNNLKSIIDLGLDVSLNLDASFNNITNSINDLSLNFSNRLDIVENIIDGSFVSETSFNTITNKTNDNTNIINFLSNQELLLKSDIQFQNTLIRDNDIDIDDIKVELNRLNHKLNRILQHLNIDINLI